MSTFESTEIDNYLSLFNQELDSDNNNDTITNDDNSSVIICEECDIPTITHGLDIWECPKCGSIVEQLIDNTAEWRTYPDGTKSDSIRCSAIINNLLPQSSKGTIILSNPT